MDFEKNPACSETDVAAERRALLDRILASSTFKRSPRLREFLTYVVNRTLSGEGDNLNEYQIGLAVFQRPADYSPSEDNIVRGHARQLRIKLDEYFSTAGKGEPVLLEIPKGSYIPVFHSRPEAAGHNADRPGFAAYTAGRVLIAAAVIGWLAAAFLLYQLRTHPKAVVRTPAPSTVPAPLSWVLDEERPTSIVAADSCFGFMQDLAGRTVGLDQYLSPQVLYNMRPLHPSPDVDIIMQRVRSRQLTSYADLVLITKVLRLSGTYQEKILLRFARDLRMRDIGSSNLILLGSSYSNPWVGLFDRRRNFRIGFDAATRRGYVVNKQPRPGEAATYSVEGEDGRSGLTYGLVTFLPSEGGSGNALIIDGPNMEGTEAAGQLITDSQAALTLLRKLQLSSAPSARRYFEVLVRTTAVAGASRDTEVVAWRND
jgi:hypothetical protein